jgi:hypothetical protein
VVLGGLSKMVEDSWDLNGDDPDLYRDADLAKDFFPPGQFTISFEKNGSASALMKIEATLDTKIPGTGGKITVVKSKK